MADRHMRALIKTVPDGAYEGRRHSRGRGPRLRRFRDQAEGYDKGDACHIAISSPPQISLFINSYEGNFALRRYLGL